MRPFRQAALITLLMLLLSSAVFATELEERFLCYVAADRTGEGSTVMLLNLGEPLLPRPLTRSHDADGNPILATNVTIAPDNHRLAFEAQTGYDGDYEIYLTDLENPGIYHNFTRNEVDDSFPAWSPDGTMIALFRGASSGEGHELYVIDAAEGKISRKLTSSGTLKSHAAWHPDSVRLVYTGIDEDGDDEIYLTDALGSFSEKLTDNDWPDYDPAWHPDGRRLAICTAVPDEEGNDNYDIILLDTVDGSLEYLVQSPGLDINPCFSADGEYMVFASDRFGNFELFVYELDSGFSRQVTYNDASDDLFPVWID